MKRIILGGLLAGGLAAGSSALAADDTGAWYVAPMGQYTFLDNKRAADDNFGYQAGLGYNFAPNWAAEINGASSSFKVPPTMGAHQALTEYSLDFLYKFLPDSGVRPFLMFGGGELTDRIGGTITNHHAGAAEAGGGLLFGIGSQEGSTRFQLRTEAKYRMEFLGANAYNPRDPGDVVVSAGFQVMFGAPVARTVVAAPPPPPPPPPPAAPPPPPPAPVDSDGDGVPDTIDQCPDTPKGDRVDAVGCTIKDEIKLDRIHFATDSAELQGENSQILDYGVATLKKYPELVIEVAGHTDNRGTKQHNQGLSQRRAETVMRYLQAHGVTNKMTAHGYGEDDPLADNSTPEGRQQNRRVGLRIVGGP